MEWLITLITLVFFSTNTEAEQLGVKDFDSAKNLFWEAAVDIAFRLLGE